MQSSKQKRQWRKVGTSKSLAHTFSGPGLQNVFDALASAATATTSSDPSEQIIYRSLPLTHFTWIRVKVCPSPHMSSNPSAPF